MLLSTKRFAEVSTYRESRIRLQEISVQRKKLNRCQAVLERYFGAALETERFARFVRRGGLSVEHLAEGYDLLDQLGVRLRALFAADTEIVFQTDSHVAA